MIKLIMLSGGIDSTGLLFKYLTETNDPIHVHHIRMVNREDRFQAEDISVKYIIEEARKIRPFTFSCSNWEWKDYMGNGYVGWDIQNVAFVAGHVVKMLLAAQSLINDYPEIETYIAVCKDDLNNEGIAERMEACEKAFESHFLRMKQKPQLKYCLDLTTNQLYEYLSGEVKCDIISCRKPQDLGNNVYVMCGNCFACQHNRRLEED